MHTVRVHPSYHNYPYGYIKEEDLPKRKSESGVQSVETSDIIHTYSVTSGKDWEKQLENGEAAYYTTHYELNDGTWATGERLYQYRLELSGRYFDNDFKFIVLSNTKDITFEQVFNQWRLDIYSDEFLHPDDAVVVGTAP